MNTFKALVKRELLDGKNGYFYVPAILAAITLFFVFVSGLGFGELDIVGEIDHAEVNNLGEAVAHVKEHKGDDASAAIAIGYTASTMLIWVGFPFVVLVRLVSCLYDERRDRSILFWKSMPTADWQEVLAKFFVPLVVAPLIFFAVAIVTQLIIGLSLMLVVLFQGGPALVMLPLMDMLTMVFAEMSMYLIYILWALPILAWMMMVSAYSNRMPFLWAILPPAVLAITEVIFLDTAHFGRWLLIQIGAWMGFAFDGHGRELDGPREVLNALLGGPQMEALSYSLSSGQFWLGLVIAGGFVYGAIEMRKRAI